MQTKAMEIKCVGVPSYIDNLDNKKNISIV